MCGRFTLTADPAALQDAFPGFIFPEKLIPRYNIAPSQPIAVVPNDGNKSLDYFTWGLIPSWAKDPKIGNRMINARSETLAEKPSFRSAYRRRRCMIIADGFYEWKRESDSKSKTPYYIHMEDNKPFAFAGLWERWFDSDGSEIKSCTIITTEPNETVAQLHNRMPAILLPDDYDAWIDPDEKDPDALSAILFPYPLADLGFHPVSKVVNNPSNDVPDCIRPAGS